MPGHYLIFNCNCGLNGHADVGVGYDLNYKFVAHFVAYYDPDNHEIRSDISENIPSNYVKIKDPFLTPYPPKKRSIEEFTKDISKKTDIIFCPACKKNELTVRLFAHWCP